VQLSSIGQDGAAFSSRKLKRGFDERADIKLVAASKVNKVITPVWT
jgi:hypothetical protein